MELLGLLVVFVGTASTLPYLVFDHLLPSAAPLWGAFVFQVVMMPVGAGAAGGLASALQLRRIFDPAFNGDLDAALAWAQASPMTNDPFLHALICLEVGDVERASIFLETVTPDKGAYARGLLTEEQGDEATGFTRMHEAFLRDRAPADVLLVAQALRLGHPGLPLLEMQQAARSRYAEFVSGVVLDEGYATCHAWALAVEGRPDDARTALPVTPGDLPPVLATERDYLRAEALRALGDPTWQVVATRGAEGLGRCSRWCREMLPTPR